MFAHKDILSLTVKAGADVGPYVCLGFDDLPTLEGGKVKGVTMYEQKRGEDVAVIVIGTVRMISSGGIAPGDAVQVGAEGKVTKAASGQPFGTALSKATNPGEFVTVLLK